MMKFRTALLTQLLSWLLIFVGSEAKAEYAFSTLDSIERGSFCCRAEKALRVEFYPGNYVVGEVDDQSEFRNFFIFDLGNVPDTIVAAALYIDGGDIAFRSTAPSEHYFLYDVLSSTDDLFNPPDTSVGGAVFSDLGSGISYGDVEVSPAADGSVVVIELNAKAVEAMNATTGIFTIGGTMSTLGDSSAGGDEWLFALTGLDSLAQLVLTISLPQPSTVIIGSCDTGVPNIDLANGFTISNLIADCAEVSINHGAFVRCVTHHTGDLKRNKTITGKQKGPIQRCAALMSMFSEKTLDEQY